MQGEAKTLVAEWTQAFNTGRVADLASFYAPDARVVPPGRSPLVGVEAIRGFFIDIRAQGFRDYAVELGDVYEKEKSLIVSGRWTLRGPNGGGASHLYEGNWLNVLVPGHAGRLIAVHMWN
jgi:ketosteroid isomerase-like protein